MVEIGLAVAVLMVALDRALMPLAGVVLSVALLVGLLRRRDRWVVRWLALGLRYRLRVRDREAEAPSAGGDPRLRTLRLLAGDVTVTRGRDHDGREVGLVGHEGAWSAVLTVDAADGTLVVAGDGPGDGDGARSFPLGALAVTLADRGVVLDAVTALWHCRPGGVGLAAGSPAVAAYRELLGPLPDLARRDAHLIVRLDPARCPGAIDERGGGVTGAQRALLGALARIERVLGEHGAAMRPLDVDEVLRTAVDTTGLADEVSGSDLWMREHWGAVVVGGTGHATFAVTGWPPDPAPATLSALTGGGAEVTVLALTLGPGSADAETPVGARATVRLVATGPAALEEAGAELLDRARGVGLRIDPLDGQHAAGLVATLPLGTGP